MRAIFSYDSKFNQILLFAADLLILNVVFLLCCIPLFTIGAAQAGLYSGIRQLMNKEDDVSCLKHFFKGFATGFKHITLVHTVMLLIFALLFYNVAAVLVLQIGGNFAPLWMVFAGLFFCGIYHAMLAPFHASFGCTTRQLIKNVAFVAMGHPLCSLWVTFLVWFPVIMALINFYMFMQLLPLWLFVYYAFAYLFVFTILKKPFKKLEDNYYAAVVEKMEAEQGTSEAAPEEAVPEAETVEAPALPEGE